MLTRTGVPRLHWLSPRQRDVLILANPKAGAGKSQRVVAALAEILRHRGYSAEVCRAPDELSDRLGRRGEGELRCVVAAGGDGTLREVIGRAPGAAVAPLPLGNENLAARFCGLGRDPVRLADVITSGGVRACDLARCDGRPFCLMATAGFDAEVVRRSHRRRRGHINHLGYLVPLLQSLQNYAYPEVEVEVHDDGERLRGAMALVFNLPQYALRLPLGAGARPDDGLLDVLVLERPGVASLARYFAALLGGTLRRLPDCRHRLARRVRLSSSGPVPLQADGDPAGFLPVTVEVVPGALNLLVPAA